MKQFFLVSFLTVIVFSCNKQSNPVDVPEKIVLNGNEYKYADVSLNNFNIVYNYKEFGYNQYSGSYSREGTALKSWSLATIFHNSDDTLSLINDDKLKIGYAESTEISGSTDYITAKFDESAELIDSLVILSSYSYNDQHASYSSSSSRKDMIVLTGLAYDISEDMTITVDITGAEAGNKINNFSWSRSSGSYSYMDGSSSNSRQDVSGLPVLTDSSLIRIKLYK